MQKCILVTVLDMEVLKRVKLTVHREQQYGGVPYEVQCLD